MYARQEVVFAAAVVWLAAEHDFCTHISWRPAQSEPDVLTWLFMFTDLLLYQGTHQTYQVRPGIEQYQVRMYLAFLGCGAGIFSCTSRDH